MYLMLRGLFVDGHDPLTLTSLSLYRFDNVLYMRTVHLLLNTFSHAWSRLVTLYHELLYIHVFDLYTVSETHFDATYHNLTDSHVR
jgi:hypothetical protein